ncbi:Alpha/beta hydrolase family protein [Planctomycetes bacterium Poly30]|uniref:Alpha/beta hydrolase family protein n=1 Tax=Saltatorellus ferox TaxID=2528018 RepID=A0A518EU04_9BACT|nr:Alpha/beta hydrolase family protein [Planctomycetes bacterium Poly30]
MNRSILAIHAVALFAASVTLAPSSATATPLLRSSAQGASLDQVGVPFCPGDGCPCGNESANSGCGNDGFDQDLTTGALLSSAGTGDVVADDLEILISGIAPGAATVLFMGSPANSVRNGDGLLCIGAGSSGLYRFPIRTADSAGTVTYGQIVATSQAFGAGALQPGDTRAFQAFYRDAMGPCGAAFNATSALSVTFSAATPTRPVEVEMGGRPLAQFPHFERVDALNEGDTLSLTLDGTPIAQSTGMNVDIYVVAARSAREWALDATLVDARGSAQAIAVIGGAATNAIFTLDAGTLTGTPAPGPGGDRVGTAYDLVVDVDRDGLLGPGDLIDGGGDEPALIIARDTVQPSQHAVTSVLFNGGSLRRQKIYYPSDIATMGAVPLVVVSHGNGHNYQWYDYIGEHLASYGYVVMSHENNTMPGIESASLTTLVNTDLFLAELGTIAGGVLDGHVDARNIAWIGHSRGAEGVARAYQRLTLQEYVPDHYGASDIRLISSMAPTVFLGLNLSNPRGVPYHVWTGSADDDVTGAAGSSGIVRSFVLHERAAGERMVTALHGAGHAVFHDEGHGGRVADGPCLLTFNEAHQIIRAHFTALMAHYLRREPGVKDFFWRQYESFAPIGRPQSSCVTVNLEYRDSPLAGNFFVEDTQTNPDEFLSSSGGAVSFDVTDLTEERLRDTNGSMSAGTSDRFNGMSRVKGNLDDSRGITFRWDAPSFLRYEVPSGARDLRGGRFLSFRATQVTREAGTVAALEDLDFEVSLIDGAGRSSTIAIGAYGGGIEEPYQRTGDGTGVGWSNEFETIRIRLNDFSMDGSALDLSDIAAIQFDFGRPGLPTEGHLGFDDLHITAR